MSERLDINTSDGETLEARWDAPDSPAMATVLCHPDPLDAGTMNAPLLVAVSSVLQERGHAVLRFNFRGTGASTGTHDHGEAERLDIEAAMAEARGRFDRVALAGWSFGAAVALSWLADQNDQIPYAGIAPPPGRLPGELPPGPKRIIVGSREQVIDPEALRAYAVEMGIDLVVTPGDHFFHGRGKRIGKLVAEALE